MNSLLRSGLAVALGLAAIASGRAAHATPCMMAPAATYTAVGFSCTVGKLTFSAMSISPSTTGDGVVGPITVTPLASGLSLTFSAAASAPPPSTADIAWLYTVSSSAPITDAGLLLTGSGTGGGTVTLSETLSNGATLTAMNPGSSTDHVTFSGVSSLSVAKDLANVALTDGSMAVSSVIENTFSTTPIPEPASIALFGFGLVGLGMSRFRKRS